MPDGVRADDGAFQPRRGYLGLGANLKDPRAQVESAIRRLHQPPDLLVVARAPLYRTRPYGPVPQPHFVNTVVEIETTLGPAALLHRVQAVEAELGRVRAERWGPRLIDVDILLLGGLSLHAPDLCIPHHELARRRFVLAPLAALAPDLRVPGEDLSVAELLARLGPDNAGEVTLLP